MRGILRLVEIPLTDLEIDQRRGGWELVERIRGPCSTALLGRTYLEAATTKKRILMKLKQ